MENKNIYIKHKFYDYFFTLLLCDNNFTSYFSDDKELAPHFNSILDTLLTRSNSKSSSVPNGYELHDFYVIEEYKQID